MSPRDDATPTRLGTVAPSADGDGHALDVVAIGSPLLDVIALTSDDEVARSGLEKGSMTLIDLVTAEAVLATEPPET